MPGWRVVGYDFNGKNVMPEISCVTEEEAQRKLQEVRKLEPKNIWFIESLEEEVHDAAI